MRSSKPVAAVEAIPAPRNGRETPAVRVDRMDTGIAQPGAVYDHAGRGDLDPISRKSREDLEDWRGVSGTGAGRQVGAGAAESGDTRGETGRDEPATGQRQRHGTIKTTRERGGEVHAYKPAAHDTEEIGHREEGKRRQKNLDSAADPLARRKRARRLHRKWRTRRTALVKAWR